MRKRRNPFADEGLIDLTSLIDVVFLVLIFFMITATFTRDQDLFRITLPKARNAATQRQVKNGINLAITATGNYLLDDGKPVAKAELGSRLQAYDPKELVVIRADAEAPVSAYAYAIGLLNERGFFRQSLIVERE